jgi:hypothetical protein
MKNKILLKMRGLFVNDLRNVWELSRGATTLVEVDAKKWNHVLRHLIGYLADAGDWEQIINLVDSEFLEAQFQTLGSPGLLEDSYDLVFEACQRSQKWHRLIDCGLGRARYFDRADNLSSRPAVRVLAQAGLHESAPQLLSELLRWESFIASRSNRLHALDELLDCPITSDVREEVLRRLADVISSMPRSIETDASLDQLFARYLRRRPPLMQLCLDHLWDRLAAPGPAVQSHAIDLIGHLEK